MSPAALPHARALGLALMAGAALLAPARATTPISPAAGAAVALRAGTIHLVENGEVLRGGGTVLVEGGRIRAVGAELEIPAHAQVIDYGDDAVLVPGFVAASSPYGLGYPSDRTASPGTRGVDGFDSYGDYAVALSGGVTAAYVVPAEGRLIAGIGALVKLGGEAGEARIVVPSAAIHGAVDASARRTPGYWEPPIPSTVDVGIGYQKPQLPASTMGAIVALEELLAATADPAGEAHRRAVQEYGHYATRDLADALGQGLPWCLSADEANEIRALIDLARERELTLIVDRAGAADRVAEELAELGAAVVFRLPYRPNRAPDEPGKERDARWPRFDVPAALAEAGVRVAIAAESPADLLFAAGQARAGGLSEADALRAITLAPAQVFGAGERLGSLAPGKDADLVVLNAEPFAAGTSVLATWVGGELAWSANAGPGAEAPTVLEVDELFVGDGRVLRPGQLLMRGGRILEVGERVSHPLGASVVRGPAAMPGMIDALGHLGLEGSRKTIKLGSELAEIVGPGDRVDRRVARRGITTVVLSPRGDSGSGVPVMAYKPASDDLERQVLGDPVAVRLQWQANNRLESGKDVRELLGKAVEYRQSWLDYEAAMAAWTPPPPEPPKEAEDEDEDGKDENGESEEEDDEDDSKKKKRKKKGEPELEPDPITGLWHAPPPAPEAGADEDDEKKKDDDEEAEPAPDTALKLRLLFEAAEGSGPVVGNLRCDAASESLIELEGWWNRDERALELRGLGSRGWVTLSAKPGEAILDGTVRVGAEELAFRAGRVSKEYVVAGRPERRRAVEEKAKEPKGKPKRPKLDEKLEPMRDALEGRVAVVVAVEREDEIRACVELFEAQGIRPVLLGAEDAHHLAAELAGRVAGVLLDPRVRIRESERGTRYLTPYTELQNAGVPVAFASGAEAGAIELPLAAAYAVANGMSPAGALRALTRDAAAMMAIDGRVGTLERGRDADVLLLDGPPLEPGTQVLRTWIDGAQVY